MEFTLSPRFHTSANNFAYRANIPCYTSSISNYQSNKITRKADEPQLPKNSATLIKNFSHKNHTPQLNKTSKFFYLLLVEAKIFLLEKAI